MATLVRAAMAALALATAKATAPPAASSVVCSAAAGPAASAADPSSARQLPAASSVLLQKDAQVGKAVVVDMDDDAGPLPWRGASASMASEMAWRLGEDAKDAPTPSLIQEARQSVVATAKDEPQEEEDRPKEGGQAALPTSTPKDVQERVATAAAGTHTATAEKPAPTQERVTATAEGPSLVQMSSAPGGEQLFPQTALAGNVLASYFSLAQVFMLLVALMLHDVWRGQQIASQKKRIRAMRSKVHVDNLITADERALRLALSRLNDEEQRAYEKILSFGLVEIDAQAKAVKLKKSIDFHDGTAHFANSKEARGVLSDLADLLRIFVSASLLIEVHTSTPLDNLDVVDEVAEDLAFRRAEVVKFELMRFGIDDARLDAIGLPGIIGRNEHRVEMKILRI